ncbi:hypothetical protein FWH30_01175 [Microgenomates group bacterium]|nr:hypothetical protein [Microgenomates group bacterium]
MYSLPSQPFQDPKSIFLCNKLRPFGIFLCLLFFSARLLVPSAISAQDVTLGIAQQAALYALEDGNQNIDVQSGSINETYPVEVYNYYENVTYSTSPTLCSPTADARMCILIYHGNLTINSGVTVTPQTRKRGLTIIVKGTLTNNGTISMTARGASAAGQNVHLWKNPNGTFEQVPATGGLGGAPVHSPAANADGNSGDNAVGRALGGGGSGGSRRRLSGAGGNATSYSGGAGGGGGHASSAPIPDTEGFAGHAGSNTGGAGGISIDASANGWTSGGGAGNPGANGAYGASPTTVGQGNSVEAKGQDGTGGLLVIYASAFINNGNLESKGMLGGFATHPLAAGNAAGGGSSGGGSINVFYRHGPSFISGTTDVDGGDAVITSFASGGAGGAGTATFTQVDLNFIPTLKTTLAVLPFGSVISIQSQDTYMLDCASGATDCTATTPTVLPFRFVQMQARHSDGTVLNKSGYTYWAFLDNYCWWGSADCRYDTLQNYPNYQAYLGVPGTAGTTHHNNLSVLAECSTDGTLANCISPDVTAEMTSYNILRTLDNFYAALPSDIAGVAKATAIALHGYDIMPISLSTSIPAAAWGSTKGAWTAGTYTPNSTSGNSFVFSGTNSNPMMTSRIGLLSYTEWQGGLIGRDDWTNTQHNITNGAGGTYCHVRFGTNCTGGIGAAEGSYGLFNDTSVADGQVIASAANPRPRYPWLRSPTSNNANNVFVVNANGASTSLGGSTYFDRGVVPSLWLQSSLPIYSGAGTYSDPYILGDLDITIENSTPNIGAYASYVSGFNSLVLAGTAMDEDIGQTLTIQYQIDGTAGSWSNLTTVIADGSIQNWSGTITLPVGLTDGTHTVYVRVYDGYGYSGNKTASFYLDDIPPANTASLVGGVLCTGIPTIYCTAPTGISLTSSDLTIGLDAYRTQWDTAFSSGDVSPAWTAGAPPSNIPTTGHTAQSQTHTLYYQTKDKLGNVSAVESISYYINSPPEITLHDPTHNHVVTPYTPLVFTGTFTDADLSQTAVIKVTIDSIDYVSPTYPTTGGAVNWELAIDAVSALASLSPSQLTNLPLVVTDSAGVSSSTYYTGQISVFSSTSSEIYISVMRNTPFSLTIGKVGAINVTFGTNQGITVSTNSSDEIIVSGSLSSPVSIPFGITTLVFTILDEPSTQVQKIEFI